MPHQESCLVCGGETTSTITIWQTQMCRMNRGCIFECDHFLCLCHKWLRLRMCPKVFISPKCYPFAYTQEDRRLRNGVVYRLNLLTAEGTVHLRDNTCHCNVIVGTGRPFPALRSHPKACFVTNQPKLHCFSQRRFCEPAIHHIRVMWLCHCIE